MHGILIVNKPRGITSFKVISILRKLTGIKRIGHAGTLDPMAEGVLPVFIGREATKHIAEYLNGDKAYIATMTLGITTDTLDAEGRIISNFQCQNPNEFPKLKSQIEIIFKKYIGEIEQKPPMYSAVHHEGRRLYELAREGKTVERKSRKITIHYIKLLEIIEDEYPQVKFEVKCSKGTYIRQLVSDIGEDLGCGAHLSALIRTYSHPFSLEQALSLEKIEEASKSNNLEKLFLL